jgi:Predicted nucleotide-binding protein containing TIR-like domain
MSNALDDLLKATRDFDFAIFVFAPDDLVRIRDKQFLTVRDNVVFELDLFIQKLGKDRSFIIGQKDSQDFHLLSDLIGVTTATFTPKENLQAALGPACNQIRTSINKSFELMIYDGRNGFEQYDVKEWGNTLWDKDGKPIPPKGEGETQIDKDGELQIIRNNIEGRYEIHLQHTGSSKPTIYKNELSPRTLRVRCEVKVESGEHTLRFVFKDEKANKIEGDRIIKANNKDWEQIDLKFQVPPTVDMSFRIDEQMVSQMPGRIKIRKLVISEFHHK